MMGLGKKVLLLSVLALIGCASDGTFDMDKALVVGSGVMQATTLTEASVQQTATLAAQQMDEKTQVASANSDYGKRLTRLTQGLNNYDGLQLNYKVYLTKQLNAFAMADGTIRVYAGLMDAMPDDQIVAVLAHEIGHVKLKHSYKQMREKLLTDTAFKTATAVGGTVGQLTASQLGQLAYAAANAHYSQTDELEADAYAVNALKRMGRDPYAMKRAIKTIQANSSGGGGFLSTHPTNEKRIRHIEKAIGSS